ncbi:MAG: TIGR01777 family protein [Actinomycetia bacterium]|nr:TIGR01777 family protein [Actinomycetes bacterium]
MEIAVTGSSGLIGTALMTRLTSDGHRPIAMVRRDPLPGADEVRWDPAASVLDAASLEGIEAVVNLAGFGIGERRWNDQTKQLLLSSRIDSTRLLAATLAGLARRPSCLLSASAVGFYGNRGDEALTEESSGGGGFVAEMAEAWEAETAPAREAGITTTLLRSGIVLSPHGGALAKMLPLFRLGLGGRFGRGDQYQSWITIDDEVGAIGFLLNNPVDGPANLTAPNPVTNAELTSALGAVLGRPALLPIPTFGPKLLLGSEMAQSLLFDSQRVLPAVLDRAGYQFEHRDIATGLAAVVER